MQVQRHLWSLAASQTMPLSMVRELNLPGRDGYRVRTHLKAEEYSRNVSVIILTTEEYTRCPWASPCVC